MNIHQRDPATGRPAATAGSAAGGRTRREAMLADGTGVREVGAEVPAFQGATAEVTVTALYQAHALRLIRLAHIMVGDRGSAEDIVQEAFCGLYRRWGQLSDSSNAQRYLHSSVLNGCRSALRRKLTRRTSPSAEPSLAGTQIPEISAETAVLSGEERQQVMAAVRRLPPRQREALVLRFYLELPEEEIAATMGIGQSTVRSATHRALASLGRMLGEGS